jgi:hypothetical protein
VTYDRRVSAGAGTSASVALGGTGAGAGRSRSLLFGRGAGHISCSQQSRMNHGGKLQALRNTLFHTKLASGMPMAETFDETCRSRKRNASRIYNPRKEGLLNGDQRQNDVQIGFHAAVHILRNEIVVSPAIWAVKADARR